MGDNRVETLKINGDVAVNFVNSFFFPTKEEIAERIELRKERDQHININRIDRGFEAEIDDLDLSFLEDNEIEEEQITISVSMTFRPHFESFFRPDSNLKREASFQQVVSVYANCNVNELDKYAA